MSTTLAWTSKRWGSLALAAVPAAGELHKRDESAERALWQPPAAIREYAVALAWIGGVAAIRWTLHPILITGSPLLIFVLPTVVLVLRGARGPAVFAAILSLVVALGLFIAPVDPHWWSNPVQQTRLMVFIAETMTIIGVGWTVQRRRKQHVETLLEAERFRAMRVTLRTVHDIVNNSLNQLQILRIDAEGHLPSASIAMFDQTVQETVNRLRALDALEAYAEKPMAIGIGLDDNAT